MDGNIFINYRRDDDAGFTQALYSRLEQAFPSESLFMDVDNIAPGLDFVQVLNDEVARCDVVIAVIGKNWLSVTDETGARRLDNPEDFVRIEIESALAQKKRVIPVLVNDARMPRSTELPETMRGFARCNAVRLTHERFRADVLGLIKSLEQLLKEAEAARRAEGEASRREVKAKEKAEAERLRQERLEARKRSESETGGTSSLPRGGGWQRFRQWVAALPSGDSWLIPLGVIAIELLVWRVPALSYWLYQQGWGSLAYLYGFLYGLSALVAAMGLTAVALAVYLRRNSLTGPGLALAWFGLSAFLSLALLSAPVASSMYGAGADLVPHGVALLAAAILIALRGRHLTGLEAAVYGIGLALFGDASVVNSISVKDAAARAQLVVALLVVAQAWRSCCGGARRQAARNLPCTALGPPTFWRWSCSLIWGPTAAPADSIAQSENPIDNGTPAS